ncbi:MAG: type I-MYXAN CRISPR-associated protein Cas6/Cmx6 [Planctomycetes bacterium]|nr:type I-MYXAN CRISPR-associated protein Cas6/Cmx6 [Planctomycetota bacterium]
MLLAPLVTAQHLPYSTHDWENDTEDNWSEAWSDVKTPGDGRTYAVGTARAQHTNAAAHVVSFSGVGGMGPQSPTQGPPGVADAVSKVVAILQVTDAQGGIVWQRCFHGDGRVSDDENVRSTHARAISVFPAATEQDIRIGLSATGRAVLARIRGGGAAVHPRRPRAGSPPLDAGAHSRSPTASRSWLGPGKPIGAQMSKVDVCFAVSGRSVPLDHGYALYSALANRLACLHDARWLGVHPLAGERVDGDRLALPSRPELRLRIPVEHIPTVLPLVGCTLDVAGHPLMVGVPTIRGLNPSRALDARLVVIKITGLARRCTAGMERETIDVPELERRFLAEAKRQLAKMEVAGDLAVTGRRSLRVGGRRVVGFSVRVQDLSEPGSIVLQEQGLGGKQTMGCGIFRPTRGLHG